MVFLLDLNRSSDMPGKILFYLILTVMVKENAETYEEKVSSSLKINVSPALKNQNSNRNVGGKAYHIFKSKITAQEASNRESAISAKSTPFAKTSTSSNTRTKSITLGSNLFEGPLLTEDSRSNTKSFLKSSVANYRSNVFENCGTNQEINTKKCSLTSAALLRASVSDGKSEKNSPLSKSCYNIPVYMSVCPQGFTHLFHNGMNTCYTIEENQKFPPSCPYPHYLSYHDIKTILPKYFNKKHIWIQAFRNITEFGFGNFEWVENGFYYGQTVGETISNEDEVAGKNCLIFKNKALERVSCFGKYHSLCMYSVERLQSKHLVHKCKQKGYDECIIGDYDLVQPKCFCKRTNFSQPEKNNFCRKLAEPIYPYQTELLIRYLNLDSSMCWFGLYKPASSGICKWSSTNDDVNYTRWAKPESCGNFEGAFKFGGPPFHGWTLATDRTLKCAICEVTLHFKKLILILQYIATRNEIELKIQNFAAITEPDGLGLYCFSDSNDNDFKHKISIDYENAHYSDDWTIVKLQNVADHPSYYWCEAFEYSSKSIARSNTILVSNKKGYGHEFPIIVSYNLEIAIDPFIRGKHVVICKKISECIEKQSDILQLLRPMRAHINEKTNQMVMLMHLTTRQVSQAIREIHKHVLDILESISREDPKLEVINFLSSEVCLPNNTITPDNATLEWPETKVGATAIPINKLCLDVNRNMLPVTRKCEGDFLYGAKWADPIGTCFKNTTYSETTEELFDLVNSNAPANEITNDLLRITQDQTNNQPIDVHLVSVVLEKLVATEDEEIDNDNFSTIISNVMHYNKYTLRKAQHLLNSTDKILSSLDEFVNNEHPLFLVSPRLVVQVTDLQASNTTGLALYTENQEVSNFKSYKIKQLYKNTSFESLLQTENLETAVLFPSDALDDLISSNQPIKLIILIFYNDFLFNEQEDPNIVQQSKTKIISVSTPGFTGSLRSPIKMAFKMPKNYLNVKNCSYWIYGLDPFLVSIHGQWRTDALSQEKASLLETCEFSHMTHFGVLLQNDPKEVPYSETALEILTTIGSALSLIGIIPIFITAVVFKSWRSRPGNIILINFCIAISIQIILLFSLNAVKEDGVACQFVGASLHYFVLSEFCWMFIVALLQHRRFVMVFKPQEETVVKKCLVVGWGFPLIPVVITVSVSVDNYKINSAGFCNVNGWYFIFAYMLPIILILCSNAFIFIKIIYNVSRHSTETCAQRSRNYKLEILLALFLFFVLGITWIFGIIGAFGGGVWFTYIFCITATLRGLVLFLFFIIGNKETRLMWKKRSTYYMENKKRKSGSTSNATVISSE